MPPTSQAESNTVPSPRAAERVAVDETSAVLPFLTPPVFSGEPRRQDSALESAGMASGREPVRGSLETDADETIVRTLKENLHLAHAELAQATKLNDEYSAEIVQLRSALREAARREESLRKELEHARC
eukprot:6769464-Pyramimonas_sp.AAC.1